MMRRRRAFRPAALDLLEGRLAPSTLTNSFDHALRPKVHHQTNDLWNRIVHYGDNFGHYIQGRLKIDHHAPTDHVPYFAHPAHTVHPVHPHGIVHR